MIEIVVFSIILGIGIILFRRYYRRKEDNRQTLCLSRTYFSWATAVFFSVIGKMLQYYYTYDVNQTNLGVITNWNFSLGCIAIGLIMQNEFARIVFPPIENKTRDIIQAYGIIVAIFSIVVPRYVFETEIVYMQTIKFLLVFILLTVHTIYYFRESMRIYSTTLSDFLVRKIQYQNMMHFLFVGTMCFFFISSIYGSVTGTYYSWPYFTASGLMILSAISGYFGIKSTEDEKRMFRKIYLEEKEEDLHSETPSN